MTNWLRGKIKSLRGIVGLPEIFAFAGLGLVYFGAEEVRPGAGAIIAGLTLLYIGLFYEPPGGPSE